MKKGILVIFSFLVIMLSFLILTSCDNTKTFKIDYIVDSKETITVEYEKGKNLSEIQMNNDSKYKKDNCLRDGWYYDKDLTNKVTYPYEVNENKTLYLKWKKDVSIYKVCFYANGELYFESNVEGGEKVVKPENPTKAKYIFVGWFDASYENEFDFDSPIVESIDLYAKWELSTNYNVNFYDGSTLLKTVEVESYSNVESYIPTKDHYKFDKWYTDQTMTKIFDFTTKITKNTNLYAKWIVDNYRINYYVGNDLYYTETVNYNNYAKGPANKPSKDQMIFDDWYLENTFENKFDITTNKITESINLYANFYELSEITITKYSGYNEGIYVVMPNINIDSSNYKVFYSKANSNDYTQIDKELVRLENSSIRADVLGLKPDIYDIKIELLGIEKTIEDITVYAEDRSGYAHFNYTSGVGAYKDDGTLKNNTVVVYVNEDNKNTVTAKINNKTYTGIVAILQAQQYSSYPLDIRIIGRITAATWNQLNVSSYSTATTSTIKGANGKYLELKNYSESDIINGGFNTLNTAVCSKLNGLTNKVKYDSSKKEFDSYYNSCDINKAKNVTIEGIGETAEIFQWGFTWKASSSIEVKNLTFTDYTEDACSIEGEGSDDTLTTLSSFTATRYWFHHNTFNKGKNYWDVCSEQDKHDGDGSTDLKRAAYITISYNHYKNTHKTGLVGGGDTQKTAAITFHHNFYDQCQSRLPFARQANMHMYNNYYYGSSGNNMQVYAGAYAFIENCYFKNVKKTFDIAADGKNSAVKSYNSTYDNCSNYNKATIVTSRTTTVANDCLYGSSFDTNSTIFYYDSTNRISKVSIMNQTDTIPTIIPLYAGAGENHFKSILSNN